MPARRSRIGAIAALCCLVAGCDVAIDGAAGTRLPSSSGWTGVPSSVALSRAR
ncbi:hypothetical protein [Amycolatopsis sp. WAC 01375]|uniref:hypothetical protein n=1 Tax=Amycolatopsis sp. WAC 01375 TaxID=2203194 RepID=UPI001F196CB9|nr:hypothetical protein [Amycolatopsis sp. WAC 01375]